MIKSKFVREKIKNASYKRSSNYIEDLMKIEHYVLDGSFGMCTVYLINSLQKKYPKEWAIWDELKPGKLQEIKRGEKLERQREKEEEAEDEKQEKLEEEKNKADWIKLGGKI